MLARYRFLPLLLVLLAASSCSKKSAKEQVVQTTADGDEIDPYANLVFTFDDAVVDAGQINRWDTTQFVKFSPAVPGKFKWTSARKLTFSPMTPFQPSTVFKADCGLRPCPAGSRSWP
jgi:hypothetical protein